MYNRSAVARLGARTSQSCSTARIKYSHIFFRIGSSSSQQQEYRAGSSSSRSALVVSASSFGRQNHQHNWKAMTVTMTATTRAKSTSRSGSDGNVFPRWPTAVYESAGDYQADAAALEPLYGPNSALYGEQSSLRRLPVPEVEETLMALQSTVEPFLLDQELRESWEEAVTRFPVQAETLQRRLTQRASEADALSTSWIQRWWNELAYLRVRDPLPVNVSYFYHYADDPTLSLSLPSFSSTKEEEFDPAIRRAATLLYASALYRREVCSGTMEREAVGRKTKVPLCSTQFKYMYHSCRVPRREIDTVRLYDPSLPAHSHAIVACRGRFFAMQWLDPETQTPLPLSILERRLAQVKALSRQSAETPHTSLGWLTAWDRDSWADARETLVAVSAEDLEILESGALMICLDETCPVSARECAVQFLYGSGDRDGGNRWYDKALQFLVTPDGKAGFVGEHSMMDGMPTVHMSDRVATFTYAEALRRSDESPSATSPTYYNNDIDETAVRRLFADIDNDNDSPMKSLAEKARNDVISFVTDHSVDVRTFYGYGSTFLKTAGVSPDAAVQMAMQLACRTVWKQPAGTYEATQVRSFLHGRTEVTRSLSKEADAWAVAASSGCSPSSKLSETLRTACDAHAKALRRAASAKGVDRHLLGLSMSMIPSDDGDHKVDLLDHPALQSSKRWRVSTSHLTHPVVANWGYGPVVSDGIGLSYSIHPNTVQFCVTSHTRNGPVTDRMADSLEKALEEVRRVLLLDVDNKDGGNNKENPPSQRSKL